MTATAAPRRSVVIELTDVSMRFGEHRVLHDITLTADSSKRLGVVGESGSGKSTLSRGRPRHTRTASVIALRAVRCGVSWAYGSC
jgi:ABC-type transporter Mla maintaining outer membrane lipid asymmetry ATPase subunit MlaF